ncbi:hypothetical protein SUGI_0797950 [Cryptomeria japonica]|nr:hypothetical protein SUGI_0797950 [Cryptomeria japonica]
MSSSQLRRLSFAQGNVLVSTHLLLKAIFCAGQCSSFHTLTAQCSSKCITVYNTVAPPIVPILSGHSYNIGALPSSIIKTKQQ